MTVATALRCHMWYPSKGEKHAGRRGTAGLGDAACWWGVVLGVVWAAPIVAGCAVIWALIQWGKPLLGGFFQGYFDVLMWVAQWGGVV